MTINTADSFIGSTRQELLLKRTASITTVAVQPSTLLDVAGQPGAGSLSVGNTANGLVPTASTAGFPSIRAFGGGNTGYIQRAVYRGSVISGLILYDRLFHAGSFAMTSLTTFNLSSQPSFAARVPDTDYSGLEILVEVNAALAASATTVSVGYTNEAGTTGRATETSASLSGFITRRLIELPLQAGDKGVQKVDSLTIGGATNASGTVNVIVARRLAQFDIRIANGFGADIQGPDLLGMPIVFETSALWPVIVPDGTASGAHSLLLTIANG